ncbi:hypothetical protein B7L88_gp144 [Rhizobium phage RHEph10]|uniref:hypothetical protein n=1 Tax=Rhizobium phage RHEph10 TaxID=1220717 RepID=UPI0002AB4D8D|nr:hypothetical protein B7L88_gp144 [Rhizobium phage RHEph10]AGC36144.1 hypothetical protein RHEph10_gp101 [Rhizobium phage RHEph10]
MRDFVKGSPGHSCISFSSCNALRTSFLSYHGVITQPNIFSCVERGTELVQPSDSPGRIGTQAEPLKFSCIPMSN